MTNQLTSDILTVGEFIPRQQLAVMTQLMKGEEGQFFKDKIASIAKLVTEMPKTYEQDGKGDAAVVYLHYYTGGCDWFITEKDMGDEQIQAFGFSDIGYGAEMGYVSIIELLENRAELDLHFKPQTVGELKASGRLK